MGKGGRDIVASIDRVATGVPVARELAIAAFGGERRRLDVRMWIARDRLLARGGRSCDVTRWRDGESRGRATRVAIAPARPAMAQACHCRDAARSLLCGSVAVDRTV